MPWSSQTPANLLREFPLETLCVFLYPFSSFLCHRHISACPAESPQAADTHCSCSICQGGHVSFLLGRWLLRGSRTALLLLLQSFQEPGQRLQWFRIQLIQLERKGMQWSSAQLDQMYYRQVHLSVMMVHHKLLRKGKVMLQLSLSLALPSSVPPVSVSTWNPDVSHTALSISFPFYWVCTLNPFILFSQCSFSTKYYSSMYL